MTYNPEEHKEQWLRAIDESGGMVTIVAQKLGMNRKTVAKYRDSIDWIRDAFEESDLDTTDLALKNLKSKVATNPKVACWWLEKKAKHLGFGREMKVDANVTHRGKVIIMLPDNGRNPGIHERRQDTQT